MKTRNTHTIGWFGLVLAAILFLTIPYSIVSAQETIALDSTTLEITTVTEDLYVPWEILWGPDDFIWMTERNGFVSRLNPENGEKTVLLEIENVQELQESGLLGMVLHPDFENEPYVYLVYTYSQDGDFTEKLVRYNYNETAQTLSDEFVLIDDIPAFFTHSGSRLIILPDNTILMSTGDVQDQASAQDPNALSGKILRVNLDGSIPNDNPFGDSPIFSIGHRNPQGMVLGPNGILYSSEHGPTSDDEINILEVGRNYGWPDVYGFCNQANEQEFCEENDVAEPLITWTPTIAPAGIDFYDNPIIPEWENSLIMAVLKTQDFRVMKLTDTGENILYGESSPFLNDVFGRFRDVCIAPDGRVFLATSNNDAYGDPLTFGSDKIIQLKSDRFLTANFSTEITCQTVNFNNTSVLADSYIWDFGDGTSSTEPNPIHTYEENTIYTVQLIAIMGENADTIVQQIEVECNFAIAQFTVADSCLTADFTNTSEFGENFIWNFGDGSGSTLENPSHTYEEEGMYEVRLVVGNNYSIDTAYQNIEIVGCDTGLDDLIDNATNDQIQVYPNPFDVACQVSLSPLFQATSLEVLNTKGQILQVYNLSPNQSVFSLERDSLTKGLYFLRVQNKAGQRILTKIVVK